MTHYPGTKPNCYTPNHIDCDVHNPIQGLPAGMSQLDYLWKYFGNKKISTGVSKVPDPNSIVTEEVLNKALANHTDNNINQLKLVDSPYDNAKLQLLGVAPSGELLTIVDLDKEDHLQDIKLINSTLAEIERDMCDELDEPLLVLTMMSGKSYSVNLSQFKHIGVETKSIKTTVTGNRIAAQLKIDQSVETPVVDVKVTKDGLKVDLLLKEPEQGSQLKLIRTDDGLNTSYTWDDGNNILFKCMTFNEYKLLEHKEPGKIYFIPDAMCIYLNGIRYGDNLSLQDTDTIEMINNNNVISLEVKLDPNRYNLLSKSKAGLAANIFWEE